MPGTRLESEERDPFSLAELRALWPAVSSEEGRRRWVPTICLYTGLRPKEAVQLHWDDFEWDEGLEVILVQVRARAPGQTLKTPSARRTVPLVLPEESRDALSDLIGLSRGQGFPFGGPEACSRGTAYPAIGRWFSQLCRRRLENTRQARWSLYSLRHTIATNVANLEPPVYLLEDLLGHRNGSESTRRYRSRATAVQLLPYLREATKGFPQ